MTVTHRALALQAIEALERAGHPTGALRRQLGEADATPEAQTLQAERERLALRLMNTAGEVERHRMPGCRMQAANKVLEWIASQLRAGRY